MSKRDFISDNLIKISSELREVTKNGANLPVFDPDNAAKVQTGNRGTGFSKAQANRLSDVYKAKIDILSRISRSLALWSEAERSFENSANLRKKLIAEWTEKLKELKNLQEPENTSELTQYIRTVENFRMDFFTSEARTLECGNEAVSPVKSTSDVDIKQFYKQTRLITVLFTILIIVSAIGACLIAATIWFAMNL